MDVFIISQPPSQIIFESEQREKNSNITRNSSTSLTLLTLLSADEKSAVLLTVPLLTKVEVCIIPSVHFPRWLCLVYGQLATSPGHAKRPYVNANVSVSSIFDNGFPLEQIQLNVDRYLISIFIHHNTKSTTSLNIYSIQEERPKTFLKTFLIYFDRLTLPGHPQDVIFEHIS